MTFPREPALTWACHVCGRERPDDRISVASRDASAAHNLPEGTIRENVRYCNDDPACAAAAVRYGLEALARRRGT